MALITIILTVILIATYSLLTLVRKWQKAPSTKPLSVNYHFTRKCNKTCVFCFHTEKISHIATDTDMKRGLKLLQEAGMKKINFAGGEPFLYPAKLGMLCQFCKQDLALESVSIISNGTKITKKWLEKYGRYVDVLGVSCDSFNETTNIKIGRGTGENVKTLFLIRGWCREMGIKFKLNTVVLRWNWEEDMASTITLLDPFRWKVFQVLPVGGENDASTMETLLDQRKRNVRDVLVSKEQFGDFCRRHEHLDCFVPETNELMAKSYLILDEYLRFLDKGDGVERASASILEVGVCEALAQVEWDQEAYVKRGAVYEWSRDLVEGEEGCGNGSAKELDW
ncbi:related to Radical S-adenosyl methionine domain-containing protein 2 [Ramularia collo-cygni]|uniref:Related to Radical S-adenosyl methionine domain-containing protein 2 n=1 Tax=Ramularia collo-cygni TaxID=112498 RepID=A0A2D3UWL4_9PEZI|nr:related to Radical S-adenosyl methionine domain-containing protein 2 [Ramularia collo-cygni]CZT22212.1 related to Radical S-adenosyl methionine domain-containing protein 2 [Ramularia collo-cygni]